MTVHPHSTRDGLHYKKYPYIDVYFVAIFQYFNGAGSVYVCIRKSNNQSINQSKALIQSGIT